MLNYVNVNDQSLLLIGCSNGTHESVSQSSQPAISPQPRLPHSIDVDSSQRMDTWGLPNKYYSNSSVTLFPMSVSSSYSHRRLNAHLKCDWDVIVSFDWPFVGRHFTELIPLHCRPYFSLSTDNRTGTISAASSSYYPLLGILPLYLFYLSRCTTSVIWVLLFPIHSEERLLSRTDRPLRRPGHSREHRREEHQVLSGRRRGDRGEPEDQQLDGDL